MNSFERFAASTINFAFSLWPQTRPHEDALMHTKIVAHRGVHENGLAIENTLAAFQLARDNGISSVEFDIRFTQDGIPIVHHDPHCGRCFFRPDILIGQTNFSDLRKAVPQIPSFAEVIALLKNSTHMMIEIKEDLRHAPAHVKIIEDLLRPLTPVQHFHLISLSPEFLEVFKTVPKDALIDVFWFNVSEVLKINKKLGHGAVAGYFLFLSQRQIQALHSQNRKVGVGYLESKNSLYREINRGADYVFTNHPLRLNSYLMDNIV